MGVTAAGTVSVFHRSSLFIEMDLPSTIEPSNATKLQFCVRVPTYAWAFCVKLFFLLQFIAIV